MSDLVITSRPLLIELLTSLEPYIIFKRRQVDRALWLLPQIAPRLGREEFLRLAREVDAFAALNHSKTKRISAADVEQHLRGKGFLAPVTTSSLLSEEMGSSANNGDSMNPIKRRPLETG
jgi:hypothetical protein